MPRQKTDQYRLTEYLLPVQEQSCTDCTLATKVTSACGFGTHYSKTPRSCGNKNQSLLTRKTIHCRARRGLNPRSLQFLFSHSKISNILHSVIKSRARVIPTCGFRQSFTSVVLYRHPTLTISYLSL